MYGALAAGGAVAVLFASALAPTQNAQPVSDVPTEKIRVGIETINGSGCPDGTAAVAVSPDNTAFTVTYSDYLAQVGVGAVPTDSRKNCQLSLRVQIPGGFTYAIASVDYRGYAHLQDGATALQRASYYHQGESDTVASTTEFAGPLSDNWQATDSTEVAELNWAPCGVERNFNVNTELRVSVGSSDRNSTSFMTMDSTDGAVSTVYHVAWKECDS
ncbi:DUF4360 domain-containing protein [Streptomyces sp. ACA25]|uniref:DUF4360 domain-containing protein n=1 Tax=Streptomyces sp. ACA25 TaxID=3022596 RepID=UPI0023072CE3|nr:DUF4360 domain-containing protein [Streptomyces sp. ACA25]MDB1087250.1 DUF4360 domain-containing protein [Streptomyces sp. ACA25]